MGKKTKKKELTEQEMELVDIYYVPTVIAEPFRLLREHCASEVITELEHHFPIVKRETLAVEVGEVIAAYNEAGVVQKVVELSPVQVSKLEKEISAERLTRYLLEEV